MKSHHDLQCKKQRLNAEGHLNIWRVYHDFITLIKVKAGRQYSNIRLSTLASTVFDVQAPYELGVLTLS